MTDLDKISVINKYKRQNTSLSEKLENLKKDLESKEEGLQKYIQDYKKLQDERANLLEKTNKFLEESKTKYELLFEEANDAIFLMENDVFVECNSPTLTMFGCDKREQIIGKRPQLFSPEFQPDGQSSCEKALEKIKLAYNNKPQFFEWAHNKLNGDLFDAEVSLNYFEFQDKSYLLAVVRDVTERKKLAYYDFLTKLPNRRAFFKKMESYINRPESLDGVSALLFLDFDRFKHINDTMGHNFADRLLIEFSERVNICLTDASFFARIGGDEFVVFISDLGQDQALAIKQMNDTSNKLLTEFRRPFIIASGETQVAISIGVTTFKLREGVSVDELIQEADLAMYDAKKSGGNKVRFYKKQMKESLLSRLHLESNLRNGIENHDIRVVYQPIFNKNKKLISVEALSRWSYGDKGEINPELFISVAEETGLIMSLGMQMLEKAINDIMGLNKTLSETNQIKLSVNISPFQLQQSEFVPRIIALFEKLSIPRHFLIFEITENVIIYDLDRTIEKLIFLKSLGLKISLDDFGTGYSALNLAKKLPLDILKIDKSYIAALSGNKVDTTMIEIFIAIGKHLKLEIVGEGIETVMQYDMIYNLGCDMFQGYLLGKPMPLSELYTII